jgi:hypothetical protein
MYIYIYIYIYTISSLETLLAPKTLWTAANFWGSWGEKYGEKGHSSAHLLLKSLHAAQGVRVFKVPELGPLIKCLLPIWEDASVSLLIFFPISSNLSLIDNKMIKLRRWRRRKVKVYTVFAFSERYSIEYLPVSGHSSIPELVVYVWIKDGFREEGVCVKEEGYTSKRSKEV